MIQRDHLTAIVELIKESMTQGKETRARGEKRRENRASQAGRVVKNPPAVAGDLRDVGVIPGHEKILGRRPSRTWLLVG